MAAFFCFNLADMFLQAVAGTTGEHMENRGADLILPLHATRGMQSKCRCLGWVGGQQNACWREQMWRRIGSSASHILLWHVCICPHGQCSEEIHLTYPRRHWWQFLLGCLLASHIGLPRWWNKHSAIADFLMEVIKITLPSLDWLTEGDWQERPDWMGGG